MIPSSLLSILLSETSTKDINSTPRTERGGRIEEGREHGEKFPRVDICKVEGRFGG